MRKLQSVVVMAIVMLMAFSSVSNACAPKPKPEPKNVNTNLNTNKNTNNNNQHQDQSQYQGQKQGQKQSADIDIVDNSVQEDRREFALPVTGPTVNPLPIETGGDGPNLKNELVLFFGALKTLSVGQLDSLGQFVECKGHTAYLARRTFEKDDSHKVTFTSSSVGIPLAVVVLDTEKKCSMLELVGVIGDYASQVKAGKACIVDAGYKKIIKGSGHSFNLGGGFSVLTDKASVGRAQVASSGFGFGKAETDEAYLPWIRILLMK